jgi:hypothetical protein
MFTCFVLWLHFFHFTHDLCLEFWSVTRSFTTRFGNLGYKGQERWLPSVEKDTPKERKESGERASVFQLERELF